MITGSIIFGFLICLALAIGGSKRHILPAIGMLLLIVFLVAVTFITSIPV